MSILCINDLILLTAEWCEKDDVGRGTGALLPGQAHRLVADVSENEMTAFFAFYELTNLY